MNGSNNPSMTCHNCNENPLPILKFIDNSLTNYRTYNVLIGCSRGHLTPFVIKSSNTGKVLIEHDKSILGRISSFEKKFKDIISNFKKVEDLQDTYSDIINSIISKDKTGSIIHIRYFMEVHQKLRLFNLLNYPESDETEEMWAEVKGSPLYSFFSEEKKKESKLSFEKMVDSSKKIINVNKNNIEILKNIYNSLSEQLHYFKRDKNKYKTLAKKEWAISDVISKFEEFLEIAKNIEDSYLISEGESESEIENEMERGENE